MRGVSEVPLAHPRLARRQFLQAGGLSLAGLGLGDLLRGEAEAAADSSTLPAPGAVGYLSVPVGWPGAARDVGPEA